MKSGILTDKVAYVPSALFNALNQLQENCVPAIAACSAKSPLDGGTRTNAQTTMANHVTGTIMHLTKNSHLNFCGESSIKGNWTSQ